MLISWCWSRCTGQFYVIAEVFDEVFAEEDAEANSNILGSLATTWLLPQMERRLRARRLNRNLNICRLSKYITQESQFLHNLHKIYDITLSLSKACVKRSNMKKKKLRGLVYNTFKFNLNDQNRNNIILKIHPLKLRLMTKIETNLKIRTKLHYRKDLTNVWAIW